MKKKQIFGTGSLLLLTLLWGALSANVLAEEPSVMMPIKTLDQLASTQMTSLATQSEAKEWNMSVEDYEHYQWLMKNTPSGKWYTQLDPAEVLALNADNQTDMMKYAKIQAQNMHSRVTRELVFDRLYGEAYKSLYPMEKPIQPTQLNYPHPVTNGGLNLQSGDRVWLFVGTNTPLASFVYQHLIKEVQDTPNAVLDIYFVGNQLTQQSIQRWALASNIPRNVINQQVTLNYGNERFQSITKGKTVNLPYVGIVHNQNFQPITLSSVL